jgi:peptidyl-prolyl cis-trans isomerase B (cyclophilin B)
VIRARLVPSLLVPLLLLAAGCGGSDDPKSGATTTPGADCSYPGDGSTAARKVAKPPSVTPDDLPTAVTIRTNAGDIPVTLDAGSAPCAVNSLVSLAEQGFFDRTTCHRVTTQNYFVLQCGDPTATGRGGPGYVFADELVDDDPRLQPCGVELDQEYCTYNAGTVAMANAGPGTNGSQFFLVYGNSRFPPAYTVLGNMDAAGLKVVKEIGARGIDPATATRPGDGTPAEPVTITGID